LASVLSPDARMLVDAGDETGGELRGRARVSSELRARLARHPDASFVSVHVNGEPGLALRRRDGEVIGVLGLAVDSGDVIERLWLTTSSAKLSHWNRPRPGTD